jgi:hypothetical protein
MPPLPPRFEAIARGLADPRPVRDLTVKGVTQTLQFKNEGRALRSRFTDIVTALLRRFAKTWWVR